ncbi:MarR family winged helix-turn-helix transcriptional regulator [Novosphingobium sp.]|uniref:MarR family winged helix-turn-helix transcriptional regulator n=1 Tax=Novosphingobium sp. TaxID=1874826 RepID=UPI0026230604|nr:MarR family transcriptional regulator [Novosphingobium sp.]
MKNENTQRTPRVPDADAILRFRNSPGVWLTFAGAAVYELYSSRLSPIGLKPSWVTAMAIIEQQPNITQSALGRELRINRASSMATCARMEEVGLVVRTPLKGRNQTGLCLSEEGLGRFKEACSIENALIDELLQGIAQPERHALIDLLRLITNRASLSP